EEEVPFAFSIVEEEQNLMLHTTGVTGITFFPEYKVIFHQGTFYFPSDQQLKIANEVRRLGMSDQSLPLEPEYIDTFFSEALPILKQVSPIEIDEKMSKEIIEFPLKAELYLEEKDFTIIGKLNYHYGEYAIDPFSPREKTEAIIIRDVQKEQAI